ncbi:DUF302 domain-containing protein [Halosimplex salinum]|uniref:DUF302 domain-containing protein n=1 Tax=Halosimplex salinum TaxID=1710538 RepID=UPI0019CF5BE0|nr:DUF302 domain-containing protein [Halosimplex salinum]
MKRRTLVRLLGGAAVVGTAGCQTDDGGAGGPAATTDGSPTQTDPAAQTGSPTQTASPAQTDTPTETPMTSETDQTATEDVSQADGVVTITADESVEATVDRIESDGEDGPLTLMTTVDHAENAASVDEELPPTTLLIFGNPAVGTPLMQASRTVAIDLPQKLLVWEEDGQTRVAYNDPEYLARRHGIEGQSDRLEQIRSALDGLASGGE